MAFKAGLMLTPLLTRYRCRENLWRHCPQVVPLNLTLTVFLGEDSEKAVLLGYVLPTDVSAVIKQNCL